MVIVSASPDANSEAYKKLCDYVVTFVAETICANEIGFFRTGIAVTANTIQLTAANYINVCYRALILKNDDYVLNVFKEMTDLTGHSEICLLNTIIQILVPVHLSLDRTKFNRCSITTLESSVRLEIVRVIGPLLKDIQTMVSHECHGESIDTCDPTEPLIAIEFDSY